MGRKRKYTAQFKAKVAFEEAKGDKTISQIASEYGIHPQQVRAWKKEFLKNIHVVFEKEDQAKELKKALEKAYKKIGQLEVEKDFLSGILRKY
ncbi:MAG: transposase [Candidatus Aenigmarchaeota archaeon]|nr:transposase [Candidatus Aenigmarchaeota archaeon]